MQRKVPMDGETAMAFAGAEFEKHHPRETWPEWLRPCTVVNFLTDEQGRFVVSLTVSYKEPLHNNEHWEEIDGKKYIVSINPETSEKVVVFHRIPKRTEVYFRAIIDPETAQVTVLIDRDLSSLVGEELERG